MRGLLPPRGSAQWAGIAEAEVTLREGGGCLPSPGTGGLTRKRKTHQRNRKLLRGLSPEKATCSPQFSHETPGHWILAQPLA